MEQSQYSFPHFVQSPRCLFSLYSLDKRPRNTFTTRLHCTSSLEGNHSRSLENKSCTKSSECNCINCKGCACGMFSCHECRVNPKQIKRFKALESWIETRRNYKHVVDNYKILQDIHTHIKL